MALEGTFDYPDDLVTANPANGDDIDEGAAHLRGIKQVIRNYAQNFNGQPLDQPILQQLFPPGVAVVQVGDAGNPGNQLGGTWEKVGELRTVAAVDEVGAPGLFPDAPLYLFRRVS